MRRVYGARREILLRGAHEQFGRWLEPVLAVAGLHLAALTQVSMDVSALVESARQREVGVHSVDRFLVGNAGATGLVFGYGALDERGIVTGLARLRRVFGK
jgi:GntR family transcriptional regulator / MocR family aminotransferase